MLQVIRKAFDLLLPGRKRSWVALVLLSVLVSVLETLAALSIYLLGSALLSDATEIAIPVLGTLHEVFGSDRNDALLRLSLSVGALFVLRSTLAILLNFRLNRFAHDAGADLSTRLFARYLSMPYIWHLERSTSESIRNVHASVTDTVSLIFVPLSALASESLVALGLIASIAIAAPRAALLTVIVIAPFLITMFRLIQPRMARLGRRAHDLNKALLASLSETLSGVRDLKLLGRTHYFVSRYAEARRDFARTMSLRATLQDAPRTLIETLLVGFVILFLAVTLWRGGSVDDSLALLGLFAYAGLRIIPSINRLLAAANGIRFGKAGLEAIHHDLTLATDEEDQNDAEDISLQEQLELRDVTFAFNSTPVVRNIDLTIVPGEVVGIVGPSGGGKSTLLDLIAGLLQPTSGLIAVDGQDVASRISAWQRKIGMVSQNVFLLDATLRENVALGQSTEDTDEDAVVQALDLAQLTDFVGSLPNGLDTQVGERGVRLSGGQRQRVAIARALYRRPNILILDEGTSALDNITELQVMKAVRENDPDRTLIVVAHRLTTVRECNRLYLIEDGSITGAGAYDTLLDAHEGFRRLVSSSQREPSASDSKIVR